MTMPSDPKYKESARVSSNLMMQYDGEWLQGNYEEAGTAIWAAGLERLKMANLSQQCGDIGRAASDFLSASSCFVKAGNLKWAKRALEGCDRLGPPGANRQDLLAERSKREREI